MSNLDLLVFGCAVSFIALAGAYVYSREQFTAGLRAQQRAERPPAAEAAKAARLKDVA